MHVHETYCSSLPDSTLLGFSISVRFLHYNFVCALLNDLFGVQSRGGCQCAGPCSQRLLGLSLPDTRAVEAELLCKHELLRPGFSRFSLSYVNSDQEASTAVFGLLVGGVSRLSCALPDL